MARTSKTFRLGDETFGDRVRRAYYKGKAQGRYDNWAELAERVSRYRSISVPGLIRIQTLDEKPTRAGALETVWLLAIAMGVDPRDLGLEKTDIKSQKVRAVSPSDLGVSINERLRVTAA